MKDFFKVIGIIFIVIVLLLIIVVLITILDVFISPINHRGSYLDNKSIDCSSVKSINSSIYSYLDDKECYKKHNFKIQKVSFKINKDKKTFLENIDYTLIDTHKKHILSYSIDPENQTIKYGGTIDDRLLFGEYDNSTIDKSYLINQNFPKDHTEMLEIVENNLSDELKNQINYYSVKVHNTSTSGDIWRIYIYLLNESFFEVILNYNGDIIKNSIF